MLKKIQLLLLFVFVVQLAKGQSSPVQINSQVVPPAPTYFADYANANVGNSPLRVQLLLRDLTLEEVEVRLKVSFSGRGINFQSNNNIIGAQPILLEGGKPVLLQSADLAPYFQYQNITGIAPNLYGAELSEGTYQICFEVFEALTNRRLSQKSCTTVFIFKNNPPILVAPSNRLNITESNPQNIVFQWTPRSINVSNVEYELSLVEVWDANVDPQTAFLTTPPIFQTTTKGTSFVYGPSEALLLPEKKYAWRVQAKAKKGTEDIGLFKNRGYSEIFSFSYATPCDPPFTINSEPKGANQANISWEDTDTTIPTFKVRYRKQGNTEWFYAKTTSNWLTLWDLKPETTYEYQVSKTCSVSDSSWSIIKTVKTESKLSANGIEQCGISPNINLENTEPLPSIKVDDGFKAGDFDVKISEVQGSDGRFTGKGYIRIPYLNSIKVEVEFTNILINTDKQLAEGMVITTYDITAGNIVNLNDAIDTVTDVVDAVGEVFEGENDLKEITVDFEIPSVDDIEVVNGEIIITDPATGQTKKYPANDDTVITDSSGNTYHIDEETGKITKGGQVDYVNGAPATAESGNIEGVQKDGDLEKLTAPNTVTFKSANGTYGFDGIPEQAKDKLSKYYETIKDVYGNNYTLIHQAVAKGGSAKIIAKVNLKNSDYTLEDVIFKTKQGEILPKEINKSKNEIEVTLTGRYSFEHEPIYAVVKSKANEAKQLVAGAFTLWHLTPRKVDIKLVPVNATNAISGADITAVEKIFKKAAANVVIETTEPVTLDASILGENGLDVGDSPWLSAYNEEQKEIISRIKGQINYSKNTYYVFVFGNDIQPSKSIAGFMPLQRQYGFIFTGKRNAKEESKGNFAHTLAHEIGHGVFALQHPFTKYKTLKETTGWLMDYDNGVALSHLDWAQIHNPALKFYIFQKEEDGEFDPTQFMVGSNVVPNAFSQYVTTSRNSYSFVSIVGRLISIPKTAMDITFGGKGDLFAFTLKENGKQERYVAARKGNKFRGYLKTLDKNVEWNKRVYQDNFSKNLGIGSNVDVYTGRLNRKNGSCGIKLFKGKFKNNVDANEWNSGGNNIVINVSYKPFNAISNQEIIKEKINSPEACDLCPKGEDFYNKFLYLAKNETNKESLNKTAKLLCENPTFFEVLIKQIDKDFKNKKDDIFWLSDQAEFEIARDKFWERDNAFSLYYDALVDVKDKINFYKTKLNLEVSEKELYAALYYLNDDYISSLSLEKKKDLLKAIFKHNYFINDDFFVDGYSDISFINKIVKTIDIKDLNAFLYDVGKNHKDVDYNSSAREVILEICNAIEPERLKNISLDVKVLALQRMLKWSTISVAGSNYNDIIVKVIESVKNEEAETFLNDLETKTTEYGFDRALVSALKDKLKDLLSNEKAYTNFFKELIRLTAARAEHLPNQYEVVADLPYDVDVKDYILVSFVRDRNNYEYTYNYGTNKVNIFTCKNSGADINSCNDKIKILKEDVSPFDFVMIYFLEGASPFDPLPNTSFHSDRASISGKGYLVPILFLEYLGKNTTEERIKNFAWNTFNVAITVSTLGEGAAAITAVRVAANSGVKVLIRTVGKNLFSLVDFAYTVTKTTYQFSTDSPLPPEFQYVDNFLMAKGAYDLIDGGLKGLAALKKVKEIEKVNDRKEALQKIIDELGLKSLKDNKSMTDDQLETLIEKSIKRIENTTDPTLKNAWEDAKKYNIGNAVTDVLNKIPTSKTKLRNFVEELSITDEAIHTLNQLPEAKLKALAGDFEDLSSNIRSKFKSSNYIEGWQLMLKRPQMRLDEDILDAAENLIKNNRKLVKENENVLEDVFEKLAEARAGCKSCPNSNTNIDEQVGMMSDIINDLDGVFVKIEGNTSGLNSFLSEMGQSAKKAKGGSFTLKTLNSKWDELTEGGYNFARFEGSIPDIETGHKLDVLFTNLNNLKRRSIECKNWKTVTSINADETSQFYQYIKSGSEFRYYFNNNVNEARKAFQNVFKDADKAKSLFNANPNYFKGFKLPNGESISRWEQIKDLANNDLLKNHPILNFIH